MCTTFLAKPISINPIPAKYISIIDSISEHVGTLGLSVCMET